MTVLATANLMAADYLKKSAYYKEAPQFHTWPDPEAARYEISLELIQPTFTMRISAVEPGSPAAATGQLKKGQIIASINRQVLKDRDPRVLLGEWITSAEAKEGVLKMIVKNDTVTLFLPGTDLQLGTAVSNATAVIDQSVFDTVTFFQ